MTPFSPLFDTNDFPPRWHCGAWTQLHGWTHIVSDVLIFGAYFAIPVAILRLVWKRPDVPFPRVFWLFAAFILLCGFGHLVEATLFWHPWYRFSALIKASTAIVSLATVVACVPVLREAIKLPGIARLNEELQREIGGRKEMEEALRQSEQRVQSIIDSALDAIVTIDGDGKITGWNPEAVRLFGWPPSEAIGQSLDSLIIPDEFRQAHQTELKRVSETGNSQIMNRRLELTALRKNGETFPVELAIAPIQSLSGTEYSAFIRDLSERKRSEDAIRASLHEKEILLKEVHHRVKNNLQIVSSLLNLQANQVGHPEVLAALSESRNRIRTMALVHEKLYQAEKIGLLDLADYTRSLANELRGLYATSTTAVTLEFAITAMPIGIETAIPCALIVNELLSNVFKYAFSDGRNGVVRVELAREDEMIRFSVRDDGVGFAPDYAITESESLGLQLVRDLARQLGGSFEINSQPGDTHGCVKFPAERVHHP